MMNKIVTVVIFTAIIFASVKFKMWQCEEMFPNANLTACLFWK